MARSATTAATPTAIVAKSGRRSAAIMVITAATVAASGGTAALASGTLGPPWHVLAGAFAGILAAYAAARPESA